MATIDTDRDSPELRESLRELATVLAGQLTVIGNDLAASRATPWQSIAVAGKLDNVRREVDYLRKQVAGLRPSDD